MLQLTSQLVPTENVRLSGGGRIWLLWQELIEGVKVKAPFGAISYCSKMLA